MVLMLVRLVQSGIVFLLENSLEIIIFFCRFAADILFIELNGTTLGYNNLKQKQAIQPQSKRGLALSRPACNVC